MSYDDMPLTRMIAEAKAADPTAARDARAKLFPHVAATLRRLAAARLRGQRDASFEASGLVHQAFVELLDNETRGFASRAEFFRIASKHIWQLIAQHARRRRPLKLSPDACDGVVDDQETPSKAAARDETFLRLHQALIALEATHPDAAAVFRAAWFLDPNFSFATSPAAILKNAAANQRTFEQIGELLGTSRSTAFRLYTQARLWLRERLSREGV